MVMRFPCFLVIFLALGTALLGAQEETDANPKKPGSGLIDSLFNFLNMSGTKSKQFRPMTQAERNHLYFKTMVNPLGFVKVGFSAGLDQANDKPTEWEQGASGYGKRYANILGQYSIQRTVTYALGSAFHEDNRYFNSGEQGFWLRTRYAIPAAFWHATMMEACTFPFPRWAGWRQEHSWPGHGFHQVRVPPAPAPSASASPWRAIWDSAW